MSMFVYVLFAICVSCIWTQERQGKDIEKFLEDVKQAIQKVGSADRRLKNQNSKFKTEKTIRKLKIRKQIIRKYGAKSVFVAV